MKVLLVLDDSRHGKYALDFYLSQHRPENEVIALTAHKFRPTRRGPTTTSRGRRRGSYTLAAPPGPTDAVRGDAVSSSCERYFAEKGVRHRFVGIKGDPGTAVCSLIQDQDVQFVIVGERSPSAAGLLGRIRRLLSVGRILMGDLLLRQSPVPVTLCRMKTHQIGRRSYGSGVMDTHVGLVGQLHGNSTHVLQRTLAPVAKAA